MSVTSQTVFPYCNISSVLTTELGHYSLTVTPGTIPFLILYIILLIKRVTIKSLDNNSY